MNEQIEKWSQKPSHVKLENLNKSYRQLWLTFYRNASICANNMKLLEASFRNYKFSNFSKELWIFVESKNPNLAKPQVRIVETFGQSVFSTRVSKTNKNLKFRTWENARSRIWRKHPQNHSIKNHYLSIFNHFFQKGTDSLIKKSIPKKCTFERVPSASVPTQKSFLCRAFLGGAVEIPWFFYWEMISWIWYDRTKRVYRPYTHRVLYV